MSRRLARAASMALMASMLLSLASLTFNASAQPDCLINGHVLDAQSNQPIQGASITFTNKQNSTVSNLNADGLGYYSINLPYAPYTVHVEEPGYDSLDMDVSLTQPSMIQDFRLQLTGGGGNCQIDGYVYDVQNNQPISNAHIIFTDQQTNATNDVYSDGSGHYNMNVPYGMYNAHIEAQGYNPSDMMIGPNQPSLAQDFNLQPNGNGGGSICQLEGYVRGDVPSSSSSSGGSTTISAPQPLSGVHLIFSKTSSNINSDTYTDGSGHYSISLQYGSYTVSLEKSGYSTGNEAVDANQPSATRDFELQSNGGGGNGNGNGGGGPGGGKTGEGITSLMTELGMISIGVFSIVLVCAIIVTIIIAVVVFLVRYYRG